MPAKAPVLPSDILTGTNAVFAVGSVQLATEHWEMTQHNAAANVTNARDGIVRLPTLTDANGTAELFYELNTPPEAYVAAGTIVTNAIFYLDITKNAYYTGSIIIDSVAVATKGVVGHGVSATVHWSLQSGQMVGTNT